MHHERQYGRVRLMLPVRKPSLFDLHLTPTPQKIRRRNFTTKHMAGVCTGTGTRRWSERIGIVRWVMWKEEASNILTVKKDARQGRVLFILLKSKVYLMNTSVEVNFSYATVSCLTGESTGGSFHATHHAAQQWQPCTGFVGGLNTGLGSAPNSWYLSALWSISKVGKPPPHSPTGWMGVWLRPCLCWSA